MNAVTKANGAAPIELALHHRDAIEAMRQEILAVENLVTGVMKEGRHYGPPYKGSDKKTLLKPGAELLLKIFGLVPDEITTTITTLVGDHRDVQARCQIHDAAGKLVAVGVGSCSTMESKYRWRHEDGFEVTDEPIPKDAKEKKAEYRKQGYAMKKIENEWKWVRLKGDGTRVENPDVADQWNTVLKQAKKRAIVDGVITATATSELFTQDVEEFADYKGVAETAEFTEVHEEAKATGEGSPEAAWVTTEAAKCNDLVTLGKLKEECKARGDWYWVEATKRILTERGEAISAAARPAMDPNADWATRLNRCEQVGQFEVLQHEFLSTPNLKGNKMHRIALNKKGKALGIEGY